MDRGRPDIFISRNKLLFTTKILNVSANLLFQRKFEQYEKKCCFLFTCSLNTQVETSSQGKGFVLVGVCRFVCVCMCVCLCVFKM